MLDDHRIVQHLAGQHLRLAGEGVEVPEVGHRPGIALGGAGGHVADLARFGGGQDVFDLHLAPDPAEAFGDGALDGEHHRRGHDAVGPLHDTLGVAQGEPDAAGGPDRVVLRGPRLKLEHRVDRALVGELDRDVLLLGELLEHRDERAVFGARDQPKGEAGIGRAGIGPHSIRSRSAGRDISSAGNTFAVLAGQIELRLNHPFERGGSSSRSPSSQLRTGQ